MSPFTETGVGNVLLFAKCGAMTLLGCSGHDFLRDELTEIRLSRKRSYSIASRISLDVKVHLAWLKVQSLYSLLESDGELLNLQPEPPYATNASRVA